MAKLKFINAEDFAKQYLYAANTFKYKLEKQMLNYIVKCSKNIKKLPEGFSVMDIKVLEAFFLKNGLESKGLGDKINRIYDNLILFFMDHLSGKKEIKYIDLFFYRTKEPFLATYLQAKDCGLSEMSKAALLHIATEIYHNKLDNLDDFFKDAKYNCPNEHVEFLKRILHFKKNPFLKMENEFDLMAKDETINCVSKKTPKLKYNTIEEISNVLFAYHYKERRKNVVKILKFIDETRVKYPNVFNSEELKTIEGYCYILHEKAGVCFTTYVNKAKDCLYIQLKNYINGERELGLLKWLSYDILRNELSNITDYMLYENYKEEYSFVQFLLSFGELHYSRNNARKKIEEAAEHFKEAKKYMDQESIDLLQKEFNKLAKEQSTKKIGSYSNSEGRYEGEIAWEVPNGKGKFTFNNGTVIEGEFKDGLANGFCSTTYKNGDLFEGKYVDGIKEGSGLYHHNNGDLFVGIYINDKYEGPCEYYVYDKKTKDFIEKEEGISRYGAFEGVFKVYVKKNDKYYLDAFRIYEKEVLKMEIKYETLRKTNSHNEFGAMRYYEDSIQPSYKPTGPCSKFLLGDGIEYYGEYEYCSELKCDAPHGKGTLTIGSDTKIDGLFESGLIMEGTIYVNGVKRYHGGLAKFGIMDGYGVQYDGEEYTECWINDGKLDMTLPYIVKRINIEEGLIIEGEMFEGKLHGKVYITDSTKGSVSEVNYKDGEWTEISRVYYPDGSFKE